VKRNPAQAAAWVNTISDEKIRNARMQEVAVAWLKKDATAARAWIAQSSLPASTKEQLLHTKGGG
jgi:hypothetical protein